MYLMSTIPETITITDLRRQSARVLAELPQEKLFLLLQNSKAKGALVDLDYLKTLQDTYEDYLDIIAFDASVKEPLISWKKYKEKSKKTK